ncbi:GIY-YIG nuclease family protein [Paenibacillus antri]|uniref:GIY-YIG nuclease family protein n=1 Tax=Paenibacillus antri TaxID=2582848 RepID=A0A5R9G320_9BACL|nr:GIY-YIG nuclease family protein [Paenibacillus antri]TLS50231.1 GIY-YIG nuclease family protein [Paenibacillus antri]
MDKERKKALAAEYVLSERPAGVFRLVHVESGKSFVGTAPDVNAMKNRLLFQLKMGSNWIKPLQNDWNEYGEDAFRYEVLELFTPPEDGMYNLKKELERMEFEWLERLQPYGDKGYNKPPHDS